MSDAPLPTFVPSTQAAEKAAEALWASLTKGPQEGQTWEGLAAYERNYFMQRAVDALAGAGQYLVADALAHVAENAEPYGLPSMQESDAQDQMLAAARELRVNLDLASL